MGLVVGLIVQFYAILMHFVVNQAEDSCVQNNNCVNIYNGLVVFLGEWSRVSLFFFFFTLCCLNAFRVLVVQFPLFSYQLL